MDQKIMELVNEYIQLQKELENVKKEMEEASQYWFELMREGSPSDVLDNQEFIVYDLTEAQIRLEERIDQILHQMAAK